MTLVQAYDTRTGEKLPHRVRDTAVNHPVLGKHLSMTPRQKAGKRAASKQSVPVATTPEAAPVAETDTPAAGDTKE